MLLKCILYKIPAEGAVTSLLIIELILMLHVSYMIQRVEASGVCILKIQQKLSFPAQLSFPMTSFNAALNSVTSSPIDFCLD